MKLTKMIKRKTTKMTMLAVATAMLFASTGCNEDQTLGTYPEPGSGTLKVELTDAPMNIDLVEEANVTISKIELRSGSADAASDTSSPFVEIYDQTETYNLLELRNGVTEKLVDIEIPAGSYDLIRLYVESASLTLTNGDTHHVKVPSGGQTGIKIFVEPSIQVEEGGLTELLLDFDISRSFVMKGNLNTPAGVKGFNFKPVIRATTKATTGQIEGLVTDTLDVELPNVAVWIEQDSIITTTYSDNTGEYAILGVDEGIYSLYAAKEGYDTLTVSNVEVAAGEVTTQDLELVPIEESIPQ